MSDVKLCIGCEVEERLSYGAYCRKCSKNRKVNSCLFCKKKLSGPQRKYCSDICNFNFNFKKNENGCWIWKGSVFLDGGPSLYLRVDESGRKINTRAKRWIYEKEKGKIEKGLSITNRCTNFTCVNPDHLICLNTVEINNLYHKGFTKRNNLGRIHPTKLLNPLIIEKILELHKVGYNAYEISEIYNKQFHEKFANLVIENTLKENIPVSEIFKDINFE